MKKLVVVLALLMVVGLAVDSISGIAEARGRLSCDGPFGKILNKCVTHPDQRQPQAVLQGGVGTPNAVALPWNWYLGFEATKDIMTDPFDGEFRKWVEDDHGYYVGFKFEWRGTILNLSGKKIEGAWFSLGE